jgi:hypothetical protein
MNLLAASLPRLASLGLVLLSLSPGSLRGQTTVGPDYVTFYTEPNFKGEALTVAAGASVPNLDTMTRPSGLPWTFAISSVAVSGQAKATVYTASEFRGEGLEITRSIPDLYAAPRRQSVGATWDRAIAAINVIGPTRVTPPPPTVVQMPPPQNVVVVAPPPPTIVEVRPRLTPRQADEIVQHAYVDVLNRPADSEGLRTYRERILREGWSERQIVEALQRSAEARNTNADVAITRMYREVLGRDPDAGGLNHYRQLWREGWTQGRIRDDMRRSPEGRDAGVRNAITRAYRELLGRDPDPDGLANYERLMRDRGFSERDLRQSIMNSEEYRKKHPRGR